MLLAGTRCTGGGSSVRAPSESTRAGDSVLVTDAAAAGSVEVRVQDPFARGADRARAPEAAARQSPAGPDGPSLPCIPEHYADGDSFRCRDGRRVRLLGIDAPELDQGEGPTSRASLERLMPRGRAVRLETDVQPEDRHGRTLAYAWTDAGMVNEAQVRAGMATLLTYAPNVRHVARLRAAQDAARRERAGLWASDAFRCTPREHRQGRC